MKFASVILAAMIGATEARHHHSMSQQQSDSLAQHGKRPAAGSDTEKSM